MAQPRIAVLEDVNYSSRSINTLQRLARAFGLRLLVSFETFSSLIPELETFSRPALERTKFDDDAFFHGNSAVSHESLVVSGEEFREHKHRLAAASQPLPGLNAASGGAGGGTANSMMAMKAAKSAYIAAIGE
jgi:hypothetical protein